MNSNRIAFLIRSRKRFASNQKQDRPFTSKAADVFCLILGFSTLFSVHFVGDLYMAEILLAIVFPILAIARWQRARRPELKFVYALMCLWLFGLVISDAYRQIGITDRMRGVALIVFFGINLLGMSILLGQNQRRKILYLVGLTLGALAYPKIQPDPAVLDYPWKFGYAWGTTLLALLLGSYFYSRKRYVASVLFVLGVCAIHVIENYRSPILQLLITIALVYPFIPERFGGIQILPRSQGLRLAIILMFALVAGAAADQVVKFVTTAGLIGEDAQTKNETQQKMGNLLVGGRPEFFVGLQAALDSPIIGHGSWAKDLKYFEMLYDMTVESGAVREQGGGDIAEEADGLIPGHSHIITSWVWAGIVGPVFWIYILWFVFKGISRIALARPPLAPIYTWMLMAMVWDIFFSPFAANRRVVEAFLLVVVADQLKGYIAVRKPAWRRMGATTHRPVTAIQSGSIPPAHS